MPHNQNPHYNTIKNLGIDFKLGFYADGRILETINTIYSACKDQLVPFLQNTSLYDNGRYVQKSEFKTLDKSKQYDIQHLPTIGRYDIDSSNTWDYNAEEKALAKSIYKGKRCTEFPFFIGDMRIDIIISKTGATATLVIDSLEIKNSDLFVKLPKWGDFYLKQGFIKAGSIINIIKNLK